MNDTIVHRGPDDEGYAELGETGLAMRRLSIIDLSHGHQPIANEHETVWIVFNGEIYNYRELRAELVARGHRFRTESDTETIVHLYEEKGEDVVDDLRGMFAFALWDTRRRRLLLARDRFGQKPLFYRFTGRRLLFGSEIKTILAVLDEPPPLDLDSLDDYLTIRYVPSPRTMLQGIAKLPPGHTLVLDAAATSAEKGTGSLRTRKYWTLRYGPKLSLSERDAVHETRERVREAVDSHMISDVPLGAYLSGGMDSSLIVAMMSQIAPDPVMTFSIGVKEADFNETPYAREVAERWKTSHFEEIVSPDLVALLPRMVHHLDEPSDPIAACMYHSAALAARHAKVVLGGDGGDEVFAGFDRYFGFRWVRLYAALPAAVRRALLGPLFGALPDSAGYKNLTQKLRWIHRLSFHEGGRRYAEATAFFRFGAEGKQGLYEAETARTLLGRDALESIVRGFDEAEADDDLDRMLQADVVTRLTEHSLMLTDRMTMAHSLEGRCPFLDHRLAEWVARLEPNLKMKGKNLKFVMRRASEGLLPPSILRRDKQGFMFPLGYWMKGPLVPVLRHLLAESALVEAGIFRRDAIATLLDEHLAGRADHHVRLWMLLNVEVWYRLYILREPRESLAGTLAERVAAPGRSAPARVGAD